MQALVEQIFTGIWRSFKVFKHSGAIKLNTRERFEEFQFTAQRLLIISLHEDGNVQTRIKTDQWMVELQNKRHYLAIISAKLLYEVITVNHTVMVLLDTATNEKTFFSREIFWLDYLHTNRAVIL